MQSTCNQKTEKQVKIIDLIIISLLLLSLWLKLNIKLNNAYFKLQLCE